MIKLYADRASLILTEMSETLTSGMQGVAYCAFTFSHEWSNLSKTAVFKCGDIYKDVLESSWENNICEIPNEVLQRAGHQVFVGVYGTDGDRVILPTVWCYIGTVQWGSNPSGDASSDVTLPVWAQLKSEIDVNGSRISDAIEKISKIDNEKQQNALVGRTTDITPKDVAEAVLKGRDVILTYRILDPGTGGRHDFVFTSPIIEGNLIVFSANSVDISYCLSGTVDGTWTFSMEPIITYEILSNSIVQANWDSNDESANDFIRNKPLVDAIKEYNYTDTACEDSFSTGGVKYYKVTSLCPDLEDLLKNWTIKGYAEDVRHTFNLDNNDTYSISQFTNYISDKNRSFIVVQSVPVNIGTDITIDNVSSGIYIHEYIMPILCHLYKCLDDELIPETIATREYVDRKLLVANDDGYGNVTLSIV